MKINGLGEQNMDFLNQLTDDLAHTLFKTIHEHMRRNGDKMNSSHMAFACGLLKSKIILTTLSTVEGLRPNEIIGLKNERLELIREVSAVHLTHNVDAIISMRSLTPATGTIH